MRVNGYIRAKEVRVVAPDGSQIGVKKLSEALWLADQLDLDLVEVSPNSKPPVCRLMDYGKYKYEQSVRDREARKKQTKTVIKESRLTPRIAEHDFQLQARRTAEWLEGGDKVKVTVRFRGRERERPEYGRKVIDRMLEQLGDLAVVEHDAEMSGRDMSITLAPTRKRRAEARQVSDVEAPEMETDAPELETVAPELETVAPELETVAPELETVDVGAEEEE